MTDPRERNLRLIRHDTPPGGRSVSRRRRAHHERHESAHEQPEEEGRLPAAHARTSWTADELMAIDFPEPRWAVPGFLAEGVSLLAGAPKAGKSWLSFGFALAVAAGGKAFDAINVPQGDVLYLALEDTGRRLQHRMGKLLGGRPAPRRLQLATTCPPMPQGGDELIGAWLDRHPDARMVVIDVFAKIRGHSPPGASAYDADYAAVGRIKRLADLHSVAIVLVHHVRKMASDDFLTEVSGTNGLAGAADTTLVLKRPRGSTTGTLHITGRDVDENDYAVDFQPDSGAWYLLDGPPEEHNLGKTRTAILGYVRANPDSTPKAIADGLGINADNARKTCQRMAADTQLVADTSGRYRVIPAERGPLAGTVPPVPAVPASLLTCQNGVDGEGQARDRSNPSVPRTTDSEGHDR